MSEALDYHRWMCSIFDRINTHRRGAGKDEIEGVGNVQEILDEVNRLCNAETQLCVETERLLDTLRSASFALAVVSNEHIARVADRVNRTIENVG